MSRKLEQDTKIDSAVVATAASAAAVETQPAVLFTVRLQEQRSSQGVLLKRRDNQIWTFLRLLTESRNVFLAL